MQTRIIFNESTNAYISTLRQCDHLRQNEFFPEKSACQTLRLLSQSKCCVYPISLDLSFAKLFVRLFRPACRPDVTVVVETVGCVTPTISSSEDVASLGANIASIVQRSSIHHALAIRHALPDACCNVLTVLHGVLLHLFDVGFFGGAVSSSNALIVAHMQRVTLLEWSKERLLFLFLLFLRESDVRTVCREAWVEFATLTHSVRPWLLTVKDFPVLPSVLVTTLVLFTFIGVLRVSHLVQVRERLCLDARCKSWCTLGNRALGRSQRDVLKLRFSDFPVRLSQEGLCL